MKILAIRGENLASLVGNFELVLDQEPVGPAGLFAISGPTGSGKSTLLDAMCLALYARTPRLLSKASSSVNSLVGRADEGPGVRLKSQDPRGLLSRGCGSGHAEVDFTGQDGRAYRARWTVRRSRNNPGGRYQAEQVSLTEIESGQRLGEHKKDSLELIQQKLGLDYDQFRRSVLLAQGDFAAFLEADPSERGALLESITGMEIYSRLSIAAHERAKAERGALDLIRVESEGLSILSDEEKEELEDQEADRASKVKRLEAAKTECTDAAAWHTHHRGLADAEARANDGLLTGLRAIRDEAGLPVTAWVRLEEEDCASPDLLLLWREFGRELSTEVEGLAKSEAELDEWKRGASKAIEQWELAEKAAVDVEKELREADGQRKTLQKSLIEQDAWLAAHQEWKDLCTQWPRWREKFGQARLVAFDLFEALRERDSELVFLEDLAPALIQAREDHAQAKATHDEAEKVSRTLEQDRDAMPLDQLVADQTQWRARREQTGKLLRLSHRWQEVTSIADKAGSAAEQQAELANKTDAEKQKVESERRSLDSARREAQRQVESIIEKQSLEEHRKRLTVGKPCPLCGSLQHPYSNHLVQEMLVDAQGRTAELGKQTDAAAERLVGLSAAIGSQRTAQAEAVARQQSAREEIGEIETQASQCIAILGSGKSGSLAPSAAEDEEGLEQLETELIRLQRLEDECGQRLERRAALDKEIEKFLLAKDSAQVARLAALEKQRELEADMQKAELGIKHARQSAAKLEKDLARFLAGLEAPMSAKPGWKEQFLGERDLLFEELEQLALDWTAHVEDRAAIEKQIHVLEAGRQALGTKSEERRKRADELDVDRQARLDAIAKRQAAHRGRLGGQKSHVLREQLSQAGNLAVLLGERAALVQQHAEGQPKQGLEACQESLREITEAMAALCTELETLRYKLRTDKDARVKLAAMLPRMEAQQQASELWTELADLIGSYDGRKFRDFAQSLSLDAMISHANDHLADLAPRYRLERVPGQDLDLQILDLHMGEEVRGVHSLSGGESFLVSHALALGLSSMHASHCSLESLFIDEGFGSLDEESLETAIAALDALQATGRQIGLISHVAGLAERIGREVRVIPLGGGRSKLEI